MPFILYVFIFHGLAARECSSLPNSPLQISDSLVFNHRFFFFKTIEELEKEMLNGQKLQGPQTSAEVYRILKQKGLINK